MNNLSSIPARRPVWFAVSVIVLWLIILVIVSGIAYADSNITFAVMAVGRLLLAVLSLYLLWRLGRLGASGITCAGGWRVWLITALGTIFIVFTSLYSFYGKAFLQSKNPLVFPGAFEIIITCISVALAEEILFRGIVLDTLVGAWGKKRSGLFGAIILTSTFFAVMHLTQMFTQSLPLPAALLLFAQTLLLSFWWGALVVTGKSIWPAVMAHFAGNAAVTLQALSVPLQEPAVEVYSRLLLFTLVLGLVGVLLLARVKITNTPAPTVH